MGMHAGDCEAAAGCVHRARVEPRADQLAREHLWLVEPREGLILPREHRGEGRLRQRLPVVLRARVKGPRTKPAQALFRIL